MCLEPLVEQYRDWIAAQRQDATAFTGRRREVAEELVRRADRVADRIQTGIDLLSEPDVLEAFRIANRVMAAAARPPSRRGSSEGGAVGFAHRDPRREPCDSLAALGCRREVAT